MKINPTESYVFFLARTYRARIQLSFFNSRGIQYSPYVNLCVSPYRVLNLTLGERSGGVSDSEREVGGSKPTAAVLCP